MFKISPEIAMRLLFVCIVVWFAAVSLSSAQMSLPVIEEVEPVLSTREQLHGPDTIVNVSHADRMTTHSMSGGQQLIVLTGSVRAEFAGQQIRADRIEYDSNMDSLIATGNVVVTTGEKVVHVERYEWNRNHPDAPIITPE
jgi:lipopolysaccharide assembly outer membrane protein LptD (OstA)